MEIHDSFGTGGVAPLGPIHEASISGSERKSIAIPSDSGFSTEAKEMMANAEALGKTEIFQATPQFHHDKCEKEACYIGKGLVTFLPHSQDDQKSAEQLSQLHQRVINALGKLAS